MGRFVLKRLLHMIPLLLGITFLSFIVISLAPGDYLSTLKMNPQISEDTINRLASEFGLDQPLHMQYFKWLWQVLHLNLGESISYRVAVIDLISSRAFNTIILSAASITFAWLLAIPTGIAVAYWQNSIFDRILSFLAFFGMAVPNFFLAFLLLYLALKTGWFPVGGSFSYDYDSFTLWGKIADRAYNFMSNGTSIKSKSVFEYGTSALTDGSSGTLASVISNSDDMMVRSVSYKTTDYNTTCTRTSETYYDIHLGKGDEIADRSFNFANNGSSIKRTFGSVTIARESPAEILMHARHDHQ